ncbi:MAG: Clp protease N-terminal domain-containing protein, partial [Pseudomonadales bacterium]|nr:Clp protease N-terminal domain-containing protein [Pseudomonadales bacterium]
MDKFTNRAQTALSDAQSLALSLDHSQVESAHLLAVLLDAQDQLATNLVTRAGGRAKGLRQAVADYLEDRPKIGASTGEVNISQDLARTLGRADASATKASDKFISVDRVLVALSEDSTLSGMFKTAGVSSDALLAAVDAQRDGETVDEANAEDTQGALSKYTLDLTERAADGKLDPVIGRDEEIRRTVQVLQRRTKNNPVLIGEP